MTRLAKENHETSSRDQKSRNAKKYHRRKKNNEDKAVTQKSTKIFVDRNKQLDYGCARARNAFFCSFVI